MMPIGYEFGFKKKLDVVSTRPADWETASFDIQRFIEQVNKLKMQNPLLHGEGRLKTVTTDRDTLALERRSQQAPGQKGWIFINKSKDKHTAVTLEGIALGSQHHLNRICRSENYSPELTASGQPIMLDPSEVVLLLES
jgi:starch synthase (maltosyl-transferring)